jgi:hypothetical protein
VRILIRAIAILSAIVLCWLSTSIIVFRFQNPTLTNTQLTIIQWPQEFMAGVAVGTFILSVNWLTKKRWRMNDKKQDETEVRVRIIEVSTRAYNHARSTAAHVRRETQDPH